MRIAVTGAAGFVGSHLCERLLGAGHEVRGIDAFTRFYERCLKEENLAALREAPGFSLAERNLLAPGLAAELGGVEAVCHLAGRPGVRGAAPELFELGNVGTTAAVMRAAAQAGVRRVVLASSSSVYAPARGPVREDAPLVPRSLYGRSKLRAERTARLLGRRLGVEVVVLRYFTVYGPRQRPDMAFSRFLAAGLSGRAAPLLGDGGQVRDFTYVEDAAEATWLAVERGRPGATYNVSGAQPVALREALALMEELLGERPPLERRPADPRDPRATAADLGAARRELGWEPRVALGEGLERQLATTRAAYTLAA